MRRLLYLLAGLSLSAQAMPEGTVFRDTLPGGQPGPELVVVPAGQFELGDLSSRGNHNERPPLTVQIARSFAIGRFEITFADWRLYQQDTRTPLPDNEGWGLSDVRPVINVSWQEARAYCQWLSRMSGQRYRLPTEAEWEYAARAGSRSYYWWGEQLESPEQRPRAHCRGCNSPRIIQNKTAQVGRFAPNAFGLYDTAGNVWEWTASRYAYPWDGSEQRDAGLLDQSPRVVRGGAWNSGPAYLRSSLRDLRQPDQKHYALGLRVVRELD